MMREYLVYHKDAPTKHWYQISAPSKRIARWCAMNVFAHEYCGTPRIQDWVAKRFDGKNLMPVEEVF